MEMDRQMDGQTNGWIDSYKIDGGGLIDGHTMEINKWNYGLRYRWKRIVRWTCKYRHCYIWMDDGKMD